MKKNFLLSNLKIKSMCETSPALLCVASVGFKKKEMQNIKSITEILNNVNFMLFDMEFKFNVMEKGDGFLIQLSCHMKCNSNRYWAWQKGGKYYISSHAINDEIVLTAWKACQDFIIHEARETFSYKGQSIFQPHYSVDELAEFCATSKVVSRPKNNIADHIEQNGIIQDIDF